MYTYKSYIDCFWTARNKNSHGVASRWYSDSFSRINRSLTREFFAATCNLVVVPRSEIKSCSVSKAGRADPLRIPIRRPYTDNVLFDPCVLPRRIASAAPKRISMHLVNKIESRPTNIRLTIQLVFRVHVYHYIRYFFAFHQRLQSFERQQYCRDVSFLLFIPRYN